MKRSASRRRVPSGCSLVGEQRRVVPRRLAVVAPVAAERPARQLFARIPLALAAVNEAVRAVVLLQPVEEVERAEPLGRTQRGRLPLVAVAVGRRHERRLAAHRQPHVVARQVGVDRVPQREDVVPLRVGVRLGHARRFEDALHRHLVTELDFAFSRRRPRPARHWSAPACTPAAGVLRRRAAPTSDPGRSSPRRAGRPRTRHGDR